MKFIRTYINKAIRDSIIHEYVFNSYKLKQVSSKPKYLTYDQFQQLEAYFEKTSIPLHKKHLHYFLFACVTGLRYSDLKELKWSNIKGDWISIEAQKTESTVSIPINSIVKKYLPKKTDSKYLFDVPTNEAANRILKDIQKKSELTQNLSTHVARHTFATICLNFDFPLSVVQKLLGHKSIKTTEGYAKIIDKKLESEMKKWDIQETKKAKE